MLNWRRLSSSWKRWTAMMPEGSDNLQLTSRANLSKPKTIFCSWNHCMNLAKDLKLLSLKTSLKWFPNSWKGSEWFGIILSSTSLMKEFQDFSTKFPTKSSKDAKPTSMLMICWTEMWKNALKTSMMQSSVVRNGDRSMINLLTSSTKPNKESGNSQRILSLLQFKPLCKDAHNWSKFAKGNYNLLLKAATTNFQSLVAQGLPK